jgi:hypothetical protein
MSHVSAERRGGRQLQVLAAGARRRRRGWEPIVVVGRRQVVLVRVRKDPGVDLTKSVQVENLWTELERGQIKVFKY